MKQYELFVVMNMSIDLEINNCVRSLWLPGGECHAGAWVP